MNRFDEARRHLLAMACEHWKHDTPEPEYGEISKLLGKWETRMNMDASANADRAVVNEAPEGSSPKASIPCADKRFDALLKALASYHDIPRPAPDALCLSGISEELINVHHRYRIHTQAKQAK